VEEKIGDHNLLKEHKRDIDVRGREKKKR